jgi:hypothetical protein
MIGSSEPAPTFLVERVDAQEEDTLEVRIRAEGLAS